MIRSQCGAFETHAGKLQIALRFGRFDDKLTIVVREHLSGGALKRYGHADEGIVGGCIDHGSFEHALRLCHTAAGNADYKGRGCEQKFFSHGGNVCLDVV